jgi:O-acetyl-ADP-ribose deacetylase (regulator of RNase III)
MGAITYRVGDATLPEGDGPKVIVHICNDIGGWGRGFVVALSRRYPEPEAAYRAWYVGRKSNDFALGAVQFVEVTPELWAANLIGQRDIRAIHGVPPVRYDAIRAGLAKVKAFALEKGASAHMPRIGAGLAGGDWDRIAGIITDELVEKGVAVTVYDLPT